MVDDQENLQQESQTVKRVATPAAQFNRQQLCFFHKTELIAARATASNVGQSAREALIARLIAASASRPLIPRMPTWNDGLESLQHVFPEFEKVVEIGISRLLRVATSEVNLERRRPLSWYKNDRYRPRN